MQGIMTDEAQIADLILRAQNGSRAAYEELMAISRKRLASWIRRRVRPDLRQRLSVESLADDSLSRAFESLGKFSGADRDSWFAWLSGIARNVILREIEGLKRGRVFQLDPAVEAAGPSPSRILRRVERLERFREALDCLSGDHRQVIRLCRIEGLRIQDAAKRMGRSPAAVKMLLGRALRELKRRFGDTESLRLPQSPPDTGDGAHDR